jgi:RNA polymerase sigma-70 factor, ECF subfamily
MTTTPPKKMRAELTSAYENYEGGLHARARYKIQDSATSEDLVQITFMKTWVYLVKGGKIDIMRAFLYHVLNGLIIDEYRKHKATSLDVLIENGFEPVFDDTKRLFNIADGKIALQMIERLPPKYQVVMRMRYIDQLSLKEISIITGLTKNTVAVQAHRGLEKLKVMYRKK